MNDCVARKRNYITEKSMSESLKIITSDIRNIKVWSKAEII